MRSMTYRQKSRLKRAGKIALIVLGALLVLLALYLIIVERYVIYTDDGVRIDYSRSAQGLTAESQSAAATAPSVEVDILYEQAALPVGESGTLNGYYITAEQLSAPQAVLSQVESLDYGTPVMLELKDIYGKFYYKTNLSGAQTADIDLDGVEQVISALRQRGCRLIAWVPAFSDSVFALEHQSCGLPISGGALWMDENGCYWLDPASETVMDYLRQIARDLTSKGFSEVVFDDFYFPASQNIVYHSEQTHDEIIAEAARQLTEFFSGSNLTISFAARGEDFPTEHLTGRLYLKDVDAAQVERYAAVYSSDTLNADAQLVFFTNSKDTRFDSRSTMRPLP